jgi:hypothetical protein
MKESRVEVRRGIVFAREESNTVKAAEDVGKSWTTEELSRLVAVTEHTLSELLVLLYQVVQTNQSLVERAYREQVESNTGQ